MIISKRNHRIARQKKLLRIALAWAISSSVSLILMTLLCGYAFLSRPIKLVPMSGNTMSISDLNYSPDYLLESAKKVAQLRFTFNPTTIKQQYQELTNLTAITFQKALKKKLNEEIEVINHKEIASVFYVEGVQINMKHHSAIVTGDLNRASHGIALKSEKKGYEMKFRFNGSLELESIKEIHYGS